MSTRPATAPESVAFLSNVYGLGYLVPRSQLRPARVPADLVELVGGAL